MDAPHRIRITLAGCIVLAAAGSIAFAGSVTAGAPPDELQPNLKTVSPGSFSLVLHHHVKTKTTILRLSNKIANAGRGPLELLAAPATAECLNPANQEYPEDSHDLDAVQRIYEDDGDGTFERDDDTDYADYRVGCFEYHQAHNHWHFQDFSRYTLEDVATGELLAGPSRKIGFCILDGERKFPALPGSPDIPVYPSSGPIGTGCGFGHPESGPGKMGLSVGYADIYTYSLPGQRLEISGVKKGTYCLVSRANPPGGPSDIIESDLEDNSRRRQVTVWPAKDQVEYTGQGCPAPKR